MRRGEARESERGIKNVGFSVGGTYLWTVVGAWKGQAAATRCPQYEEGAEDMAEAVVACPCLRRDGGEGAGRK